MYRNYNRNGYQTEIIPALEFRLVNRTVSERAVAASGGYDPFFFDQLALVEDRHFWFVCRNELLFELARKAVAGRSPKSYVLEVGCGTGNVLRFLAKSCTASTVIGIDRWAEGLRHARKRTSCALLQADLRQPPFARPFDVIGMFDVLEHLPDDAQALRDIHALLAPGGNLLMTVPAHQCLWSYFDDAGHHCRRYESRQLRNILTSAGFRVEFLTQFMASIFPLVWVGRRFRNRRKGRSATDAAAEEFRVIPGVNSILKALIRLENRWILQGRSLPLGTSLLAVARKPAIGA